jgi:hypothetical protein
MNTQEPRAPKEIKVVDDYVGIADYIPAEACDQVDIIHQLYASHKTKFVIQLIDALLKKYSADPYIVCTAGYTLFFCGKKDRGYTLLKQNFEQNPYNIYAKCYFARVNLLMNNIDAAFDIFEGKLLLEELYPDKEEFFVGELSEICFTFGMFFSKIKIARGVYRSITQLEQFLPNKHPYIQELYQALKDDKVDVNLLAQEMKPLASIPHQSEENSVAV